MEPSEFLKLTQTDQAKAAQALFDKASIGQFIQAHANPDGSMRLDWSASGMTPQQIISILVGGWMNSEISRMLTERVSQLEQTVNNR